MLLQQVFRLESEEVDHVIIMKLIVRIIYLHVSVGHVHAVQELDGRADVPHDVRSLCGHKPPRLQRTGPPGYRGQDPQVTEDRNPHHLLLTLPRPSITSSSLCPTPPSPPPSPPPHAAPPLHPLLHNLLLTRLAPPSFSTEVLLVLWSSAHLSL